MAKKEDKRGIELDKDKLLEVLKEHILVSNIQRCKCISMVSLTLIFSTEGKVVRTLRSKYDQHQ